MRSRAAVRACLGMEMEMEMRRDPGAAREGL
jgi:hypothetical protein